MGSIPLRFGRFGSVSSDGGSGGVAQWRYGETEHRYREVCKVHNRAGGGARAALRRVPKAELYAPSTADSRVPSSGQH